MHLSQLWRWHGQITRLPYLIWGCLLMGIKFQIDRLSILLLFDISWSPLSYLYEPSIRQLSESGPIMPLSLLLLTALPFVIARRWSDPAAPAFSSSAAGTLHPLFCTCCQSAVFFAAGVLACSI